jgi:hypothetical protein
VREFLLDGAAIIAGIAAILDALEKLGFNVRVYGRQKTVTRAMDTGYSKKSAWTAITLAFVAFLLFGISFYFSYNKADPTKFPPRVLEVVSGKTFIGQMVEIDGKRFEYCTFERVTLMYHGTAAYEFVNASWKDSIFLRTDNVAIENYWTLQRSLAAISSQVKSYQLDKEGNPHPVN